MGHSNTRVQEGLAQVTSARLGGSAVGEDVVAAGDRRNHRPNRRPQQQGEAEKQPPACTSIGWPEIIGEAALVVLLVVVPLVINKDSRNICDVKDTVLGLGVTLGIGVWLIASLARGRLSWVGSRLNLAILAFAAWAAVSLLYSRHRYVTVSELGRLAANLGVYCLAIVSLRGLAQVRRLITVLAIGAIPVCAYALYQAAGRDFIPWATPTQRVFSFLGNPTYLAGFLVLLIPMVIAAAWPRRTEDQTEKSRGRPWSAHMISGLLFGMAIMMMACLYYTVSFAAAIGLGIAGAVTLLLLLVRGGKRAARVLIPAAAAAALLFLAVGWLAYQRLPKTQHARVQKVMRFRDPSGGERRLHWRAALDIFKKQPVLGTGYGTFRLHALDELAPEWYAQRGVRKMLILRPTYAHNEYLQVLADLGIVGALLFSALLIVGYGLAVSVAARHQSHTWALMGMGIVAATTAFLFQNIFGITFRQTGAVTLFWLWLAVTVLAASFMRRSPDEPVLPRLREFTFPPVPLWGLTLTGFGLALLLAALSWLTIRPVVASVVIRHAQAAAAAGAFEEAARLADRTVQLCPYSAMGHYMSGYAWRKLGQPRKAIAATERAVELIPGDANAHYSLACAYREEGRLDKAEQHFRRAVELIPTSHKHHAAMAEILLAQDEVTDAESYAREAVKLRPNNVQYHLLLIEVLGKQGKVREMVEELTFTSELAPKNRKLKQKLASLLFRIGHDEQAVEVCKQWMEIAPRSALPHHALGVYYSDNHEYALAKEHFLRAVELNPRYWLARLNLAHTYWNLHERAAAVAELELVAERAQGRPERKRAKAMLERLLKAPPPPAHEQPET